MISVSEALSIIDKIKYSPSLRSLPIEKCQGYILAEDIFSPIDMPPFRQSAMDGYALTTQDNNIYELIGEIQAGAISEEHIVKKGSAIRIFTGAKVPDTANAVVMQEQVTRENDQIIINASVTVNQNIRPKGEQIKKGAIALTKGTRLTPAALGFLSGLGVSSLPVFTPPKVGIIITGNELVSTGNELKEGQIFESNSYTLKSALDQIQVKDITLYSVKDEYQSTKNSIEEALKDNDIILISGGISVGDYDFVKEALVELNTEELFYKIKQKPGKPLYFGKNQNKYVFALPGNPASSLTCFYIYVLPLIQKMMGNPNSGLLRTTKISISDYNKKGDRAQFLKARVQGEKVEILEGQSSAMLHTFAIANALVFVSEKQSIISIDEPVDTILLPNFCY